MPVLHKGINAKVLLSPRNSLGLKEDWPWSHAELGPKSLLYHHTMAV